VNHSYDFTLIVNRLIETYYGIAVKQCSSEFADDILLSHARRENAPEKISGKNLFFKYHVIHVMDTAAQIRPPGLPKE
jgi:hypothetical protein